METFKSHSENYHRSPSVEPQTQGVSLADVFTSEYTEPMDQESYEHAAAALDKLESLQRFRKELAGHPFASFYELVEAVTKVEQRAGTEDARLRGINKVVEAMQERVSHLSPRVADLFQALLASLEQEPYEPRFEQTRQQIDKLTSAQDQRSDLDILFSKDVSWDLKLNRIKNVLDGYLAGMRALDKREGKNMDDEIRRWREEELRKAPTEPRPQQNESRPGVDPMERLKEGERAPALWSIDPAWGGLYKEQSFTIWDETSKTWKGESAVYSAVKPVPLSNNRDITKGPIDITLTANIRTGTWYPLPSSYKHSFHTIDAQGKAWKVEQNQQGDLFVCVSGNGEGVNLTAVFAADPNKTYTSKDASSPKVPNMPALLSDETETALQDIATKYKGNVARALAVRRYVVKRIQYLAPKDRVEAEYYNSIYRTSPKGFAGAVDELKKGDCDVVNTYFAALCARLDIPVRHAVGHSVKGKDESGNSIIHSGTGHGWSEVWDETKREWKDVDSTPSGDPNLEESAEQNSSAPGYYGQQEAVCPSDEQLEALRKKLAEHTERLSYTREERELAKATNIEPREARQIVKEILTADQTRLPNGELVVDVLASLFGAIVKSRKKHLPIYTGPVRRREGGENISDIVRHYIGVLGGESDPISRKQPSVEVKTEKVVNGVDVYVVADKSGSMGKIAENGEELWKMQRRFEYLLFSSLYRFNCAIKKAHLPPDKALDVRTMGISFRGSKPEDIDEDKPLSNHFDAQDKVRMWHSQAKQGGGNGDVASIQYIYQKIKDEKEAMAAAGTADTRLRIVVAYSDGGYVGAEADMRSWVEALSELGVVVVGLGLTESAATVPIVMHNPPKSFGGIVSNMNELITATARHIVLQAIKLFPEKARQDAALFIEDTLRKFNLN